MSNLLEVIQEINLQGKKFVKSQEMTKHMILKN